MKLKDLKNKTGIQKIILILITILTVATFTLNRTSVHPLLHVKTPFKVGTTTLLILSIFMYKYYDHFYFKGKKKNNLFILLSSIFSIIMLIGNSYNTIGSWGFLFGNVPCFLLSIVEFIGYSIFFYSAIYVIYEWLINNKFKEKMKDNKVLNFIFNKHPFILPFLIILIGFIPYIIAFYPGILSPDPANQIKQFFGLETDYRYYSVMLDENVNITNHHPVLHTVILGGLAWIGNRLGSVNAGIFTYSLIQVTLFISLLAYTFLFMKKLNTPIIYRFICLLIYIFVPIFPHYAMSTLKDVWFAIFVIFYIMKLYELIKDSNKDIYDFKTILILIIDMLLITLFRNNGIYLILMSFPLLLIIDKKNRGKILITLLVPVILFYSFTNILLPYLKVTPSSPREALSIPFQQTARYVKYYGDEVTEYEKEVIDQILDYSDLVERYDPQKSDPVKNRFNRYATKEDLNEYFGVWFRQFLKHPNIYFEATLHNTYGYFYPDAKKWYLYYNYDSILIESGINFHYNSLGWLRNVLSGYAVAFPYIPLIGSLVSIGFCTLLCMTIFFFLINLKKYKYLIYLMPVVSLVLVCVASPVNTYFRYTLGYIFALPVIVAIFLKIIEDVRSERK